MFYVLKCRPGAYYHRTGETSYHLRPLAEATRFPNRQDAEQWANANNNHRYCIHHFEVEEVQSA